MGGQQVPASWPDGRLREADRQAIERAIDNAKRTAWDKWMRREFYRSARKREHHRDAIRRRQSQGGQTAYRDLAVWVMGGTP